MRLPSRTRTPRASRNASSYPCSGPVVLVTGLILVGRRGVEPRDTCLSGRPRRPAGSRPADGGGPDPRQRCCPVRFKRAPAARQVHHPREESGRLERQRRTTPGRFRGGACTLAGSLSTRGRRRNRIPAPHDAHTGSSRGRGPARFISHRGERRNRIPQGHPLRTR